MTAGGTAKEHVACRHGLGGAVNPHDPGGIKRAIYQAITIEPGEGRRRMRALHRPVMTHDVLACPVPHG